MKPTELDLAPLTRLGQTWVPNEPVRVVELAGGASSRRFFRVNAAERSAVGMYTPDARRSHEATHDTADTEREWPFVEIRALLERHGVRVPKLYAQDCAEGWLLLEDLGDLTLAEALLRWPELKPHLYAVAVRDLAQAQIALRALPSDSIVQQRRFDRSLLLWEIEHFREFGLLARGITPTAAQDERFANLAAALAERVAQLEVGFVHRDYQSRNLMWLPQAIAPNATAALGELVWIDFQDALLGPRVYDLVALLNDSYQEFSREFVETRLGEYVQTRGLADSEQRTVIAEFDLVTVQRKLKDAGRFVYFDVHNGDASYLKFVEPTLNKVRSSLARLQDDALCRQFAALLEQLLAPAS